MTGSALGDFLKSARARVSPEQSGIRAGAHRRVAGLRREEVAYLADMSIDYYIRLEQGRESNPSTQILDALAQALRLDDDGRLHLYRLAGLTPRRASGGVERVDPALLQLMDMWQHTPALVLGRAYDVLAANQLGEALFGGFPFSRNLLELVFLDPAGRSFYADWDGSARNIVAGLRLAEGASPGDPRIRSVIDTLLEQSRDFARVWEENDARGKRPQSKSFVHPDVGALELRMNSFEVRSAPGQELVVYHAEPGLPSADALGLLGTMAATRLASTARNAEPNGR